MFYGTFGPGPDGIYDRTPSDTEGAWSIPAGMPGGKFYAVAGRRPVETPAKTPVCGPPRQRSLSRSSGATRMVRLRDVPSRTAYL